jgi:hypothetical protein
MGVKSGLWVAVLLYSVYALGYYLPINIAIGGGKLCDSSLGLKD